MTKSLIRMLIVVLPFLPGNLLRASPGGNAVQYNPITKIVQGVQPLTASYPLTITSPSNVSTTSSTTVTIVLSTLTLPAGVSSATALTFISVNPATLTFTGPNQQVTTTVSVAVPSNATYAGSYG